MVKKIDRRTAKKSVVVVVLLFAAACWREQEQYFSEKERKKKSGEGEQKISFYNVLTEKKLPPSLQYTNFVHVIIMFFHNNHL